MLRGINAYTLGARSVNPNVEVRVVWTSSWYDPGKETDATKSLIGQKADVITHHTNSTAVAATCEEAKVPVISYNSAMKKAAPTMLLAGVVHLWDEYYTKRIQMVLDGTWNNTPTWGGAPEHMIALEAVTPNAPRPWWTTSTPRWRRWKSVNSIRSRARSSRTKGRPSFRKARSQPIRNSST